MKKVFIIVVMALTIPVFIGCETIKKAIGNSTATLENRRDLGYSLNQTYACTFDQCFDAILSLARDEELLQPVSGEKVFDVFMKNRVRSHIIVMGIHGNVDTTEVGIFLTTIGDHTIKVDITSLADSAQRRVAKAVFTELDQRFEQR